MTGLRSADAVVGRRGIMRTERAEHRIENVEHRVDRIEQILPTLATRDHVSDAITSSEERMRTHVSDAITASEERMRTHVFEVVTASEQRTRTCFDVVAESLRHDIRLVAEAVAALSERVR